MPPRTTPGKRRNEKGERERRKGKEAGKAGERKVRIIDQVSNEVHNLRRELLNS